MGVALLSLSVGRPPAAVTCLHLKGLYSRKAFSNAAANISRANLTSLQASCHHWHQAAASLSQHTCFPPNHLGLAPNRLQRRGLRYCTILMALKTGIVGLPNVGKSTMFNALCENGKAEVANYPFCTIEPNVGIVAVPDERLEVMSTISSSEKIIPTTIEYLDIAGLVKGASQGEGLGNKFLSNIRECDSIVQMVRCFEDENVHHVNGKIDSLNDIDTINFELALADIAQIEKRLERLAKSKIKSKEEAADAEIEKGALTKIMAALDQGNAARTVDLSEEENKAVKVLQLLTHKPLTYAANVGEGDLMDDGKSNSQVQALKQKAREENCEVVVVSAQVEAELTELDKEEAEEYLTSLGATEGGLKSLIKATYKQLGLLTYFTTGEKETRAWTIKLGMTAPQAAGVIHSDFEKGFIRAETVAYDAFADNKGIPGCKEKGLYRLEGKEYIVREGDIMNFRFNV